MVRIIEVKEGTCEASGKTCEGVLCEFENGVFKGFLSWNEFKKLCRMLIKKPQK
jgi:hypothetical protein